MKTNHNLWLGRLVAGCAAMLAMAAFADMQTIGNIKWAYEIYNGEATITGAKMTDGRDVYGDVTIPSILGGKPVVELGHYWWYDGVLPVARR